MKKRLLASLLAVIMVMTMIPGALAIEQEASVKIEGSNESTDDGEKDYSTLKEALEAAVAAKYAQPARTVTVTLLKDVTVDGTLVISKGITLDGDTNSITAQSFGGDKTNHIIKVEGGGEVTIKNLTINGYANTKDGIHVTEELTKVNLDTVTINDCGRAGLGIDGAEAEVTATKLTTDGNNDAGILIESGKLKLTAPINLQEPVKIKAKKGLTLNLEDSGLIDMETYGVVDDTNTYIRYVSTIGNAGDLARMAVDWGMPFYNYNEAYFYDSLSKALKDAKAGQTVMVVDRATLAEDTEIPKNVTLIVMPSRELTIAESVTLTIKGKLVCLGWFAGEGKVKTNNGGTLEQYDIVQVGIDSRAEQDEEGYPDDWSVEAWDKESGKDLQTLKDLLEELGIEGFDEGFA